MDDSDGLRDRAVDSAGVLLPTGWHEAQKVRHVGFVQPVTVL